MYEYKLILFYQEKDPYWELSNWYPCEFEYAGIRYKSMEQYMMYQKALIMRDNEAAQDVLNTDSPAEAKKIGRNIKSRPSAHFKDIDEKTETIDVWSHYKYSIVKRGVRAKLLQNPQILKMLLDTGNSFIGECSKNDLTWGLGESIDEKGIELHIAQGLFKGKNYLGRIYMELRQEFKERINKGIELKYIDYSNSIESIDILKAFPYELYLNPVYHDSIGPYLDILSFDEKSGILHNDTFFRYCFEPRNCPMPVGAFRDMIQRIQETYHLVND